MPLENYGVLKGRPIDSRLGFGSSPHYQVHLVDEDNDYRIAINVKSKQQPSALLYLVEEQFTHPMLDALRELRLGFTKIQAAPGAMALDYIRGNLFTPEKMVPLPHNVPGPDNDLNEKINFFVQRALADEDAVVYAFGERWGPEPNKRDGYFGFKPGNGIHDIHMNQGSVEPFKKYNGVWQDGGMLIHFESINQWVAIFLAFQSQCWHTEEVNGHCLGTADQPAEEKDVVIIAAMVNPPGHDPGKEQVLLLNTTADHINLNGWGLADKMKRKHPLDDHSLAPGEVLKVTLAGDTVQLGNKGGIISLMNQEGLKVHGVKYTREDARGQGRTIVF